MIIYRIGICDDDVSLCGMLEEMIREVFRARRTRVETEVWFSGEECCRMLSGTEEALDILFLDIELPGVNGVEIGKYIRERISREMHIVYISGKTSYAMDLFQVHPYDFLVKPIRKDDVCHTISAILSLDELGNDTFVYTVRGILYRIPFREIRLMVSDNKKVTLELRDGSSRTFTGKLQDQMQGLPPQFVRANQSYVVNLNYISEISAGNIRLEDGQSVIISRKYASEFKLALMKYRTEEYHAG